MTVGRGATPSLTPIHRQIIQKNSAGDTVAFQYSDSTVGFDSLHLSVSATDTSLLPLHNFTFMGVGGNETLIIVPALNQTGKDTVIVTVSGGAHSTSDTFAVKVNSPPRLDTNQPLTVAEGGTGTLGDTVLISYDIDNANSQIYYTIGPDSISGFYPQFGTLLLNGVPLSIGSTFTQAQVNANQVTYHQNDTEINSDGFTFTVRDSDGGIYSDNGFSIFQFTFNVTLYNHPPVAYDTTYNAGLGSTVHGTVRGTDPDSPTLHFRLATNATKGNVVIDSVSGNFTYTPTVNVAGADSFYYQVFDGSLLAVKPGKVILVISPSAPMAMNGSAIVSENQSITDTLRVVDPNVPALTDTIMLISGGHLGTTTLLDSLNGAFRYTPNAGIFGTDTITFKAKNSYLSSGVGMYIITIHPSFLVDDILFSDRGQQQPGDILLIDINHQEAATVAEGDSVFKPSSCVSDPSGILYILDYQTGLLRADPLTGVQTQLVPGSAFTHQPIGARNIAMEHDGSILIADGTAGLRRFNPRTDSLTTVSSGDSLQIAVGVAVDMSGNIYVSNAAAFTGGVSSILKIDPVSGAQTVMSRGGYIVLPIAMTTDSYGYIYVVDPGSYIHGTDKLYKIDPYNNDAQITIATSDTLHTPVGVAILSTGKLVILNGDGSAFITDTATGVSTTMFGAGTIASSGSVYVVPATPLIASARSVIHFTNPGHGSSAKDSVLISNNGSAQLVISNVTSDSSEFVVTPTSATIAAGASTMFYVTFTPANGDSITGHITFTSNSFNSPTVITVTGTGTVTGVKTAKHTLPRVYALYNNYPNPFNPTTMIAFDLPKQSVVTISVYNILGQEVSRLASHATYEAGSYTLRFDASNIASGVYFYRISAVASHGAASFTSVKKMLLIR